MNMADLVRNNLGFILSPNPVRIELMRCIFFLENVGMASVLPFYMNDMHMTFNKSLVLMTRVSHQFCQVT